MNLTEQFQRARFSRYTNAQIQIIAAELQAMTAADSDGRVHVHEVVERARDPASPLHPMIFGLTNRAAAERWRTDEARRMCRAVCRVYIDEDGTEKFTIPLLVSISEKADDEDAEKITGRSYVETPRALRDPVMRQQLLDEALRQAEYWQEKYRNLQELAPVFDAVSRVRARHARTRSRSRRAKAAAAKE